MPPNFPLTRSFYLLSVKQGAAMVTAGDGVLSTIRLVLVLTKVQLVENEHLFNNMKLPQSRIRYTVLFALNVVACILLGVGIWLSQKQPWPVLMVPWLVMFSCCTWLYYSNIIHHTKEVWLIALCVITMLACIYCWYVVFSYFLKVLYATNPRSLQSEGTDAMDTTA